MKQPTPVYLETVMYGGIQKLYRFENGYGASVIKHAMSYGGAEGFWELGVVQWRGNNYWLVYDTPITDDVVGELTIEEVEEILTQIKHLTPDETIH